MNGQSVAGALALAMAVAGCVGVPVNPYPVVPPPQAEVVPLPPPSVERLVWQPGHWQWNGATYVWLPGRYVERRALPGERWEPAHWGLRDGVWVWVPGRWV